MTVKQLAAKLGLEVLTPGPLEREIGWGYCSDLLSDVLGHARAGDLWITHQRHMNVVAVAKLKELAAILCVRSLRPAPEVVERARREGVPLLVAEQEAFEVAGRVHRLLAP
ncbi:MAG: DRTGG domain-containing protein [Candidatus Bipolaricaulaceae bacterium]